VAVLLTIIATAAVSSSGGGTVLQVEEAGCRIQNDLACARGRAIILRSPQRLGCDVTAGLYELTSQDAPGTPIDDPIIKKAYRIFFKKACETALLADVSRAESYPDVELVAADFDGGEEVVFDAWGFARTAGGNLLTSGEIEIRGGGRSLKVVVDPATGTASIQEVAGPPQTGLLSWLLGGLGI